MAMFVQLSLSEEVEQKSVQEKVILCNKCFFTDVAYDFAYRDAVRVIFFNVGRERQQVDARVSKIKVLIDKSLPGTAISCSGKRNVGSDVVFEKEITVWVQNWKESSAWQAWLNMLDEREHQLQSGSYRKVAPPPFPVY